MSKNTPKIISQEFEKFMKKQDSLPKKYHEFNFTFTTKNVRDNAIKKFLKSFPKKDITYLTKGERKSYRNGKFSSRIFYDLEMTLEVRNAHRVMELCTLKGLVVGSSEVKKMLSMPSNKQIMSHKTRVKKREKLYRKELDKLSIKELKGLENNPILGDKLIRKLKPLVKENVSSIWSDLCEISKENK